MTVTATVDETTDLARYREAWESLFRQGAHEPSSSHEWVSSLARHHLRGGDRLWVLSLWAAGTLVGLVPLVATEQRILGCPLVEVSPLCERYNTHGEVLTSLDADRCASALLSALSALPVRWDVFRMGRMLEDNALAEQLLLYGRKMGATPVEQRQPPSYYLQLPESFQAYLDQRSSKFRNHLRRVEKRLFALGDVRIVELASPAEFNSAFEHLLAIESNSWKQAHGTAISSIPRQIGFYRDFGCSATHAGRLHLSLLYLGAEPVAYNLGYLHNQRYHYLKTSYHHLYRADGIATYARARLIEQLIGTGVRVFDFPGEPYEWEQQWANTLRWHRSIAIYNSTLPAQLYLTLWRLRRLLRRDSSGKKLEFSDARQLRPPAE